MIISDFGGSRGLDLGDRYDGFVGAVGSARAVGSDGGGVGERGDRWFEIGH
jgi:hypothetical protein